LNEPGSAPVHFPDRRAIALGRDTEYVMQRLKPALHACALLNCTQTRKRLMQIAVMTDFVPFGNDTTYLIGIAARDIAGHIEGTCDTRCLQRFEDPGYPYHGTISLMD